jgi:gamma-glutamyltranspeptidase
MGSAGKRPKITLTPTLVTDAAGKAVMAISVAGGDLQDQTTLNILLNRIHYGVPPDNIASLLSCWLLPLAFVGTVRAPALRRALQACPRARP